jgi:hypothetical protein
VKRLLLAVLCIPMLASAGCLKNTYRRTCWLIGKPFSVAWSVYVATDDLCAQGRGHLYDSQERKVRIENSRNWLRESFLAYKERKNNNEKLIEDKLV